MKQGLEKLTPRQKEVLRFLADGLSEKQIADLLKISSQTVHQHIKRIYEALGMHDRVAVVRVWWELQRRSD